MGFGPHAIGGMLGAIALLAIAFFSTAFKSKPLTPEAGCFRPVYHLNNHCLEDLTADIEWYNCAGELKETDGIDVSATTELAYTLPEDSQHIHWVKLRCPYDNSVIATVYLGSCSQAPYDCACNTTHYCVTFNYVSGTWCLDGGAMNISYGPCP